MRITLVQQGLIVQQEFAKLLMMGSKGRIELAPPLTDDERRDYEIHVRGQYGFGLAVQVKSTMTLHRYGGNAHYLRCFFPVRKTRIVNNPFYWYFIAYLDPKLMRFADPVFVIPSTEFHKHAAPHTKGAFMTFTFVANMESKTRDQWHQYRVKTLDLGQKLLEVMVDLRRHHGLGEQSAALLSIPDALRVQMAKGRALPQLRKRVA
ncbi:MAG TPA: hypothetical protein VJT32_03700 [bacterium]|nr:hypothetical protein [bacterium]